MMTRGEAALKSTICMSNPDAFFGTGLTESGTSQKDKAEAVEGVLDAIEACTHCPLLAACRRSVQDEIDSGYAPVHQVRAAVFWGMDGKPDPTLAGALEAESSAALAAECTAATSETVTREDGKAFPVSVALPRRRSITDDQGPIVESDPLLPVTIPADRLLIGWDASWAHLKEGHLQNQEAIRLLLSDRRDDWKRVVTRLYLDQYSNTTVDSREIAEDSDVCAVIREAHRRGISRHSLCIRLSLGADKLEEIMEALGLPIARSEAHRRSAETRQQNREQMLREAARTAELLESKDPALPLDIDLSSVTTHTAPDTQEAQEPQTGAGASEAAPAALSDRDELPGQIPGQFTIF